VAPQYLIRATETQRVARTARGVADEFAVSALSRTGVMILALLCT
jgi:hypothetical protein